MEAALADGADLVHPRPGHEPNAQWVFDSGDGGLRRQRDEAIAAAEADDVVVKRRFRQQRLIPAFMEPRVRASSTRPASSHVCTSATQIPHILRTMLGADPGHARAQAARHRAGRRRRLRRQAAGDPRGVLVALLAQKLGKPVKWTETRSESLLAAHHGRDQIQDLDDVGHRDGTMTGLDVKLMADMGAYLGLVTPGVPMLGAFMFNAIYKIPALPVRLHRRLHHQDARPTPTAAPAGPRPRSRIERIMDELAVELGMEPMELRKQELDQARGVPVHHRRGLTYDTGNYEAATDQAMEMFDYDGLRRSRRSGRERGDPCSSASASRRSPRCAGWRRPGCSARWTTAPAAGRPRRSGCCPPARSRCVTGTSAARPGPRDGVQPDRRRPARRAASTTSRSCTATPSRRLRVSTPTGRARWRSAASPSSRPPRRSIEKAKPIAAHMLEASEDDLEFADGALLGQGHRRGRGTIQDVALAVFAAHDLPDGVEPDLDARRRRSTRRTSPSRTAPTCARSRSTPRPGTSKMLKYVCVDDVGNVINPLIVEGQVHGGLAQGIAQALFEEAAYDDAGQPAHRHAGRLHSAQRGRPAQLRHGDRTTTPSPREPAGRQGRRRGRARSPPPRPSSTRCSTRCGTLGVKDMEMPDHPAARLAGHPERLGTSGRGDAGRHRTRRAPVSAPPTATRPEGGHDPGGVRLRPAHHGRGGAARPCATAATTPRSSPAGRACCRCCGCAWPPRR